VAFVVDDAGAAVTLVAGDANAQPDALLKELAPSDAAGPAVTVGGPADGASQRDAQVTVSGTATDPSGLAGVTVNGNPVALRAGGAFSAPALLQTGPNSITVVATDGAGNATARTLTVLRTAPRPARRVLGFSASMVRGRIVLKINLSAQARVRFTVLRRTAGPPPRRVVSLLRVGPRVLKVVKPGRRIVRLVPPTRAPGRYAVRVQIVGATGRAATRTDAFLIRATRRR
jgi:hypothetical protein